MVNVNDTPTMIVPAPCCLSICIPHSLSSGTLHICQLRHLHHPEPFQRGAVWKSSLLLDMMRDHLSAQAHWVIGK